MIIFVSGLLPCPYTSFRHSKRRTLQLHMFGLTPCSSFSCRVRLERTLGQGKWGPEWLSISDANIRHNDIELDPTNIKNRLSIRLNNAI